jgi:acetyl-CoA C-acetyltransferase
MVEKCRSNPQATGLVSGVGMHMTNHVVGIYSARFPGAQTAEHFSTVDVEQASNRIIDEEASGPAVIAAYSVTHSQDERLGLAICELPNKHRCYARVSASELLDSMEREEWVGRKVVLETRDKVNTVTR